MQVILATTTSTKDSGLLDVLIPVFEKQTGLVVKPISVGSGAALAMAERGDADVLLVHSPDAEKRLVDAKVITNYSFVMYNDFIIVGPPADPAGIRGTKSAADAFKAISSSGSLFVSRGDNSGTHTKEKSLWSLLKTEPAGAWYIQSGSGMAQTLQITSEKMGYTLADRATYLAQKNNLSLEVLVEGDGPLLNIYHVAQVNPEKFTRVNAKGAKAFVDFMMSKQGQTIIGEFGKEKYGQPLFVPSADKKVTDFIK